MNRVILPFKMERAPIKKIALINFGKNPDEIYKDLELQYIDAEEEGSGYRVIAYRNDKYVDVYDEETIKIKDVGSFEVCEKGLANYKKVFYSRVCFERYSEGIHIEFSFKDIKGREISVKIKENSKKKSRAFDLLAPVGVSSLKPVMLPVFAMYDFDMIRKKGTEFSINIDGRDIEPDPFPVPFPKDGQFRHFARYGYDCDLIEFGRSSNEVLKLMEVSEEGKINYEGLSSSFQFKNNMWELKNIEFEKSEHRFRVSFIKNFPDILRMKDSIVKGIFTMKMDESMGELSGEYHVEKENDRVLIRLVPVNGWKVKPTMMLTKIICGEKSVFRTWAKTYEYTQSINLITLESKSSWKRINFTPKDKYI